MKILHIHTKLSAGGIEAMVCGLVNEMADCNDVTVCTIFVPKQNDVFFAQLRPEIKTVSLGKNKSGFCAGSRLIWRKRRNTLSCIMVKSLPPRAGSLDLILNRR